MGWGAAASGSPASATLQQVQLPVYDQAACQAFDSTTAFSPDWFCTGALALLRLAELGASLALRRAVERRP